MWKIDIIERSKKHTVTEEYQKPIAETKHEEVETPKEEEPDIFPSGKAEFI